MGLFDHFPYSNFHELNLEWVIRILREMDKKVDGLEKDVEKLTDQVVNFIKNADIPGIVLKELEDMYADGRLKELVEQAAMEISDEIIYHVPGGTIANPSGACMWIETTNGAIVFDFGVKDYGLSSMKAEMTTAGISKIKAVVISHYHEDHVGGYAGEDVINFIGDTDFDFSECTFYLPHGEIEWESMIDNTAEGGAFNAIKDAEAKIKAALAAAHITTVQPTEGQKVSIDRIELSFHNLATSKFSRYYGYTLSSTNAEANKTTYNNFSMITRINHKSGYVGVFTGDIHEPAEAMNFKVFYGADIVFAPHHGLNRDVAEDYLSALNPEIFIIDTGAKYQPWWQSCKADGQKCLAQGATMWVTAEAGYQKIHDSARSLKIENVSGGEYINSLASDKEMWYGIPAFATTDPNTFDLNDFMTPGVYSVQNSGIATNNVKNAPFTAYGFHLVVEMVTASFTVLQKAIAVGSNNYLQAFRRRSWSSTAGAWNDWEDWRFVSCGIYERGAVTKSMFVNGGDVTIHTGISQNYIQAVNDTLTVALDITPSETVGAGEELMQFTLPTSGVGAYGALFDSAGNAYPCSVRYRSDATTNNYYVRMVKAIPAGTEVLGCLVVGLSPTHA